MEEAPGNAGDLTLMHMLGNRQNMQNMQNMHPWHGGGPWQRRWSASTVTLHTHNTYNTKSNAKQIQKEQYCRTLNVELIHTIQDAIKNKYNMIQYYTWHGFLRSVGPTCCSAMGPRQYRSVWRRSGTGGLPLSSSSLSSSSLLSPSSYLIHRHNLSLGQVTLSISVKCIFIRWPYAGHFLIVIISNLIFYRFKSLYSSGDPRWGICRQLLKLLPSLFSI